MLVGMCLFTSYDKQYDAATRMDFVKRFYDAASTFKISLPTPIMSGVRTPSRQFSSCVLIECGDSLDPSTPPVPSLRRSGRDWRECRQYRALGSPPRR